MSVSRETRDATDGLVLRPAQHQALDRYAAIIRASPVALFSTADRARLDLHVEDSLAGAAVIAALLPSTLVDVGSGGGVPGVPLAVAFHPTPVTLVESVGRKASALTAVARELKSAATIEVRNERAETLATAHRERFDVATARAVAPLPVVLEYLAPLVRLGGAAVVWVTGGTDIAVAATSAHKLGFAPPSITATPTTLRPGGAIAVYRKATPTPGRYPRRVGAARKRPLT